MLNRFIFILISLILLVSLVAVYYHTESLQKEKILNRVIDERNSALTVIETMKNQRQQIAAIDSHYTQELTDAKTQLAALERDVNDKHRRMQLNATCPTPVLHTAAARLDDAPRARLNDTAIQHYFDLRERIETATRQLAGLQAYIQTICLTNTG